MADLSLDSLYEIYDSLSPYEVAVLAFTSPAALDVTGDSERIQVITTKESYLWAGAVAHALVRNPSLSIEQIGTAIDQCVQLFYEERDRYMDTLRPRYSRHRHDNDTEIIRTFLRRLQVPDVDAVFQRTEDAVRSLVWRGYIEDPFSKKLGALLTSVVLVLPVGFTSTGPNDVRIDALTWQYVQRSEDGAQTRELRLKVKEASDAVLNKIVPAAVGAVARLSGSSDGQGMKDRDVQIRLAELGYYNGAIDGIVGPRTIQAIRRFQSDHYLEVTGYLDAATLQRLKAA